MPQPRLSAKEFVTSTLEAYPNDTRRGLVYEGHCDALLAMPRRVAEWIDYNGRPLQSHCSAYVEACSTEANKNEADIQALYRASLCGSLRQLLELEGRRDLCWEPQVSINLMAFLRDRLAGQTVGTAAAISTAATAAAAVARVPVPQRPLSASSSSMTAGSGSAQEGASRPAFCLVPIDIQERLANAAQNMPPPPATLPTINTLAAPAAAASGATQHSASSTAGALGLVQQPLVALQMSQPSSPAVASTSSVPPGQTPASRVTSRSQERMEATQQHRLNERQERERGAEEQAARQAEPRHRALWKLIRAVLELKGPWKLYRDGQPLDLVGIWINGCTEDPQLGASVRRMLQQVFSHMCVARSPFAILSGLHVTYILHLSPEDPECLLVSRPIMYTDTAPCTALTAMAWVQCLAAEHPAGGRELPEYQGEFRNDWGGGGGRGPHDESSSKDDGELQHSSDDDDYNGESDEGRSGSTNKRMRASSTPGTTEQQASGAETVDVPILPREAIQVHGIYAEERRGRTILYGTCWGQEAAIKFVDTGTPEAWQVIRREAAIYQKLKHLQGRVIPELYGIADIQSGAGVLVTSFFHGTPLSQVSCTAPIGKQVLSSVSQVHAGGVVHGDLHPGNLLLVVGRPSAPAAAGAAGSGGSNSSQAVPDYSSTPEQQTGASDAAAASAQQTESTHVVVLDFGHAWWAGEDSAASAAEELKRLRRSLKAR